MGGLGLVVVWFLCVITVFLGGFCVCCFGLGFVCGFCFELSDCCFGFVLGGYLACLGFEWGWYNIG